MLARALDHLDDVLESVLGREVVDAHAARLAGPVERLQRLDDLFAGVALLAFCIIFSLEPGVDSWTRRGRRGRSVMVSS
jgi:hypothetical protein